MRREERELVGLEMEPNHACSVHAEEAARHRCYRGGRDRPIRGFAVLVVNGEWGGTAVPETVHVPIIQMRILASRIVVLLSSLYAASSGIHPLGEASMVGYVTQGPRHWDQTHPRAYLDPCPEPSLLSALLCTLCKRHTFIFPGRGHG